MKVVRMERRLNVQVDNLTATMVAAASIIDRETSNRGEDQRKRHLVHLISSSGYLLHLSSALQVPGNLMC